MMKHHYKHDYKHNKSYLISFYSCSRAQTCTWGDNAESAKAPTRALRKQAERDASTMERLDFSSDYLEGCADPIMRRLVQTNHEKTAGYGLDEHSERGRAQRPCARAHPPGMRRARCGRFLPRWRHAGQRGRDFRTSRPVPGRYCYNLGARQRARGGCHRGGRPQGARAAGA